MIKHNIFKNYIYTSLMSLSLTRGVWMLYLASRGLNLFQIGIMESIYHLSSFLMEIPTGAIADLFGRKLSRVLGRIVALLSTLTMIFADNVYLFAFSFFLSALSNNLESGAGEALIYDSLKEIGEEQSYMQINGIKELTFQFSNIISLLLGGYIASLNYISVYKLSFIVGIFALISALTFIEPTTYKKNAIGDPYAEFIQQLKDSFIVIHKDRRIIFFIIISELFATFYITEYFYIQNLLKNLGYTEFHIGILLAGGGLLAAVVGSRTYLIEKKWGPKKMLILFPGLAILGFWGMIIPILVVPSFMLLSVIESVLFIIIGDYVNRLIPSEQRATILSLQSMVFSIFMICLFPIVGQLGDWFSLSFSFKVIAGVASLILGALMIKVYYRNDIEVF